jgi:Ca2+/Na+ antiporter
MNSESFWINDISVLYKKFDFNKLIPSLTMTKTEKLNTVSRICILLIIVLLIIDRNTQWIYILILILLSTIVIYLYDKNKKEHYTINNEIQVGRFDKNDNITYDTNSYDNDNDNDNDLDSISTIITNTQCRKPSKDNPFMNNNIEDIGKYSPIACNSDDEDIKSQITEQFNDDLYKNTTNLFEQKNAERQFYTVPVPNGIPDTVKFANWAYKSKRTCKTDQKDCTTHDNFKYR